MGRRTASTLILVAALASAAQAQPRPSREFTAAYDAGVDAYNLGHHAEARARFEQARALQPDLPGPYRYLALIAQVEERFEDCLTFAAGAVRLNPTSRYSAEVRALHAACRESLERPRFAADFAGGGALGVTANVDGATVKVRGLKYGATPLAPRALAVGPADVDVEKAGWLPAHVDVEVVDGLVTDVVVLLARDPAAPAEPEGGVEPGRRAEVTVGWVTFDVRPAGAAIELDESPVQPRADGAVEATPGLHLVTVTAAGHEPWRRRVRVARGQRRTVAVDLLPTAERRQRRRIGYYALGAAGALAAAGAGFGILEGRAYEEAQDIYDAETTRPLTPLADSAELVPVRTRADLDDAVDRAKRWRLASVASLGLAAAALGVSAYYFLAERPADRSDLPPPIAIAPVDAGGGVQIVYSGVLSW